jgi:hypothetical protein
VTLEHDLTRAIGSDPISIRFRILSVYIEIQYPDAVYNPVTQAVDRDFKYASIYTGKFAQNLLID